MILFPEEKRKKKQGLSLTFQLKSTRLESEKQIYIPLYNDVEKA